MAMGLVTVFGGSGFIGRALVKRLAKAGATVRVCVRDVDRAKRLKPMGDVGQVVPLNIDVTDPAAVAAAVSGASAVVNLVGILYESGAASFDKVQGQAPGAVAKAAAAAGVGRLVQISAIGADAASPSAYARSKAAGEAAVRAAFPAATILRPSVVFGPDDDFFNRFGQMAAQGPFLPTIGGGKTKLQPVYVGDVADAIMVALTAESGVQGETFELGGPEILSFRQIQELVLRYTGQTRRIIDMSPCLARFIGGFAQHLPKPPITPDQVTLASLDNVVSPGAKGLADLGIAATAVAAVVPTYLDRFMPKGRFSTIARRA